MHEQQKIIQANLDRHVPATLDYLTRVGLINNNRLVAAELWQEASAEPMEDLNHGYWDNDSEQVAFLSQWPHLGSLMQFLENSDAASMILRSAPFQQQYDQFKSDWIEEITADDLLQMDAETRFSKYGLSEYLVEIAQNNYLPQWSELSSEPSVRVALTLGATTVAKFRDWPRPRTMGQAAVILNLAVGLDRREFSLESAQRVCSTEWFQKIVEPRPRNGSF